MVTADHTPTGTRDLTALEARCNASERQDAIELACQSIGCVTRYSCAGSVIEYTDWDRWRALRADRDERALHAYADALAAVSPGDDDA